MTTITRAEQYGQDILNTEAAAEYLHVSASTLTRMRSRYILRAQMELEMLDAGKPVPLREKPATLNQAIGPKFVRFGKKVFYRRADLDSWSQSPT